MKDVFPYRFVQVERAEADDVIAVSSRTFITKKRS